MTSSGGPYIVSHVRVTELCEGAVTNRSVLSKRAVVDLEAVQRRFTQVVHEAFVASGSMVGEWEPLDRVEVGSGGGSWILPDGSEVRVEPREWPVLASDVGIPNIFESLTEAEKLKVCELWNERFGSETQGAGS